MLFPQENFVVPLLCDASNSLQLGGGGGKLAACLLNEPQGMARQEQALYGQCVDVFVVCKPMSCVWVLTSSWCVLQCLCHNSALLLQALCTQHTCDILQMRGTLELSSCTETPAIVCFVLLVCWCRAATPEGSYSLIPGID